MKTRRKRHVFRGEEETKPASNVYGYDREWDWGDWSSYFPSQEEVLSNVNKAITNAESENVSN